MEVRTVRIFLLFMFATPREKAVPAAVTRRVVVEAGVTAPWYKYAGPEGTVIGIDCFGESGPPEVIFQHFG
ncbi:MAG TPA: hypothetical protein PKX93_06870, partial [bacterium]|nr:hypothetical protein [bacterium]